jgi:hypothetical protein
MTTASEKSNRQPSAHLEFLDDEMVEVLSAKSGAERLAIAAGMFRSARRMILSHLQQEHPDWDASEIQRETVRRLSHGTR